MILNIWSIIVTVVVVSCLWLMVVFNIDTKFKKEISSADQEIIILKHDIRMYEKKLDAIIAVDQSKPDGCVEGDYCSACAFARRYFLPEEQGLPGLRTMIVCGKGETCEHFVQKEDNDH